MSDSGRQIGDCEHGRLPNYCVPCLKSRIRELEDENTQLRHAVKDEKEVTRYLSNEIERMQRESPNPVW